MGRCNICRSRAVIMCMAASIGSAE